MTRLVAILTINWSDYLAKLPELFGVNIMIFSIQSVAKICKKFFLTSNGSGASILKLSKYLAGAT